MGCCEDEGACFADWRLYFLLMSAVLGLDPRLPGTPLFWSSSATCCSFWKLLLIIKVGLYTFRCGAEDFGEPV